MSPKKTQFVFFLLNVVFAVLGTLQIVAGVSNPFSVFVTILNVYCAKVCYNGYKRSTN